jgi:hypothetical protein
MPTQAPNPLGRSACDLLKEHLILTMNIIIKGLPLESELTER